MNEKQIKLQTLYSQKTMLEKIIEDVKNQITTLEGEITECEITENLHLNV